MYKRQGQRGLSQLALALQAEVSARHLSWLETGKAAPSRAMVLRLAERLELPLRERNGLLAAAGFAPLYRERALGDKALAPARDALQRLLTAHEPWPALAVDRHWNLVAHNRMLPLLLQGLPPALLAPPANVLRVSLHPQGLAPMIVNLAAWRALPGPEADEGDESFDDVVVPLSLNTPLGRLEFITTITVFGAPHDVTLSEIAIETLLPADETTAERLRQLAAA